MNLIHLLLRTSWLSVGLAILVGGASGIASTGLIILLGDSLTGSELSFAWKLTGFVGLGLLMLATNIGSQVLLADLSEGAIYQLRLLLCQRILASPLRHLEEVGAAKLLAALTDDIQAISLAFFNFPLLFTNLAIVVCCLGYLAWLSVPVFMLMLLVMAASVVSFQALARQGETALALAREQQDRLLSQFRAIIEGVKELKLHRQRRQAFLREDLQQTAAIARKYNVRGRIVFAVGTSWGLLNLFIALGTLIFVLPQYLQIQGAVLANYALILLYLILPMEIVLRAMPIFSKASIALAKIDALGISLQSLARENELASDPVNPAWKELKLFSVTHTYYRELEESHFTLGPIDLTLNAGEIVFIVGGNGSGKSTLEKILAGLYFPQSGTLFLDDIPITDSNREWYRQHFTAIFSDFFLFERLIGLASDSLDPQAEKYLHQLQLDRKVKIANGQLSTTALSQGQRKRLALLTAYLEDRPIYLFDEWASDQDPQFKAIFYTQLLPELRNRGKTVLVISHDDRYFDCGDRLIELEDGQLKGDRKLSP